MDEDQKEDYNDSYYLIFLFSGFAATYKSRWHREADVKWHVSSFFSVSLPEHVIFLYFITLPTPFILLWPSSHMYQTWATHFSACLLNTWLAMNSLSSSKESVKNRAVKWLAKFIEICQRTTWAVGLILLEALAQIWTLWVPLHFLKAELLPPGPVISCHFIYPQHSIYLRILWLEVCSLPVQSWLCNKHCSFIHASRDSENSTWHVVVRQESIWGMTVSCCTVGCHFYSHSLGTSRWILLFVGADIEEPSYWRRKSEAMWGSTTEIS